MVNIKFNDNSEIAKMGFNFITKNKYSNTLKTGGLITSLSVNK